MTVREESAPHCRYAAPFGGHVWVEAGEGAAGGAPEGLGQAVTAADHCPAGSPRRTAQPSRESNSPCCCPPSAEKQRGCSEGEPGPCACQMFHF